MFLSLLFLLLYYLLSFCLFLTLLNKIISKYKKNIKNPSLVHITVTVATIIIIYMFYPDLLIFSLIGGSVAVLLTLLLEYFIFDKLPVHIFVLLLILVAIFFPKYSGNVDIYAPNNTNLRCKCAGYNSKLWGIDSYNTTCYGIPHLCTTVTPTFEDYNNNRL